MKTISAILVLVFSIFCFGNDIEFIKATSQAWRAGVPGGGRGTNYTICLISKRNSEQIEFTNLWIGSETFEIKVLKNSKMNESSKTISKVNADKFNKGDSLFITAQKFIQTPRNADEQPIFAENQIELPKQYEGVALLEYKVKGKLKYLEIQNFKELEFVPYH